MRHHAAGVLATATTAPSSTPTRNKHKQKSSSSCFGYYHDVQCLKTLQESVIDPNGILKSSWIFDDGTAGYICRFAGVDCWNPDENKIMSLYLSNLGLEGQFPRGLENCTSMINLDLSNNSFSGPIPLHISWQVPFLTSLNLSYNRLSGEIPVSISNLSYLRTLNLQHNQLSGQIPGQFSLFVLLQSFNVAYNQLFGPIPLALQKFPSSNFTGNQGLCGPPLDYYCAAGRSKRRLINDESSIGAAAGFVVGFVVAFYFPHQFIFCQRLHPYVVRM